MIQNALIREDKQEENEFREEMQSEDGNDNLDIEQDNEDQEQGEIVNKN